jgi:predicted enzyme related to lactoylglutathione lyase
MAKALGIGGFFFRSRDTKALAEWYSTHLGVTDFWTQEAGLTVFSPFKQDTTYFPADKQWMINFRVDDLDALMAQLRDAGIAIETRPDEWDTPETGRFARIHDPEGNQIELWQPPAD